MNHIIQNAVKITDHGKVTYLRSVHRHHFNEYTASNNETFFVDGGTDYLRRGGGFTDKDIIVLDISLYNDDDFDLVSEWLLWGTLGQDGKGPLVCLPLSTLTTEHLENILKTQTLNTIYKKVIHYLLDTRK